MNIAKYPFAILSAALFTVMLITPITSISNLIWLASADMPLGFITWIEVILFDFQRLGIALYTVVVLGFGIAFSVAGLISRYSSYSGKYLFAVAGAVAIGMALFLMVELLFQTQLLGGNRSIIGKILHSVAGFLGGYFFYSLVSVKRSYTFIIRFLGILYAYLILGSVLEWIFTPMNAATNFGFVLNDLSYDAQNALLRDFTSFFLAVFLFAIMGVVTLNSAWFFSAGIIFIGAAIFNLIAIYVYETGYNRIFITEFILGLWPTFLALTIIYNNKTYKPIYNKNFGTDNENDDKIKT